MIAFAITAALLSAAGYAVTRIAVPVPRHIFRTSAFEFDLVPGWRCELEDDEYVCVPPGKPPFAATVVMAMKERNKDDNLQAYESYLQKLHRQVGGFATSDKVKFSQKRYVRLNKIGKREWVEALFASSEIAKYDTYYLATNTSNLGILITMSVEENYTKRYVGELNDMIKTLHVYQQ